MTDTHAQARADAVRRFRWVGLYAPVAVFTVITLVQALLLPSMPDPAATHWGATGGPDGFGPAWTFPMLTLFVGAGVSALIAGSALLGARSGGRLPLRVLAALIWWEVGLLGLGLTSSYFGQLGLDDARDAPSAAWGMAAGFGVGVLLAIAAWRLTLDPPHDDTGIALEPVALADTERAVWLRTVTMGRAGWIVLSVVVVLALIGASAATAGGSSRGVMTAVAVLLVTMLVSLGSAVRVRVDERGLMVRGPLGLPRVRVPRAEIRSTEVVHVNPMGEYGGWGWRYSSRSGWGVILRAGLALRVTRVNGKVFTVAVDEAETAAALLAGMDRRTGP